MKQFNLLFILLTLLFFLTHSIQAGTRAYIQTEYGAIERHSKTEISLCAKMSRYFYGADATKAKQYVTLSPKQDFEVYFNYRHICVRGLKPRTSYRLHINAAIPLGDIVLDKSYTLQGTTGDYKQSFSFPESGYILPEYGKIVVPVETRNVKKLAVSLYRINTRNLIKSINTHGLFRSLHSYRLREIEEKDGYKLWKKILPIHGKLNQKHRTAIPIGDYLKERKPGVYIVHAAMLNDEGEEIYNYEAKTQWFMVSDIGLFTLKSDSGMKVYTRSLKSAKLYDAVKLQLIAKNNEVLYSTTTKTGEAFIPKEVLGGKRGLRPKAIYAYGKAGDFCVLDLGKSPHDLSDRGVGGRDNPRHYDAFVYSNRGIFKPGESVPFHALVRNKMGMAQKNLALSLKLFDARGVEVYSKQLTTDSLGHLSDTIAIASSANTGRWHLKLYAGDERAIGDLKFLVEDFVPPKIKIELGKEIKYLVGGEETAIPLVVKYLTGSRVTNAKVEVNRILHQAHKPFQGYEAYYFGNMKEQFKNRNLEVLHYKTDENGEVTIPFSVKTSLSSSLPLVAHIDFLVYEAGGRPVHKIVNALYDTGQAYIGLKPKFKAHSIDMGSHALFDIVTLLKGKPLDKVLKYRLIEENVHWHWRAYKDDWEYYETYSDASVVHKAEIKVSKKKPFVLKLPKLDWGSYRLEVYEEGKSTLSSYRFSSGYSLGASKATPDKLPLAIDKKRYQVGEMLQVNIKAKFTGPAQVSIAHHDVVETQEVWLKAGERKTLQFQVKASWGNSAYVLAAAFKKGSQGLGANRAIGVMPLQIERPEQQLTLSLNHQERVGALSRIKVELEAKEAAGKETAFTLAAVDEGVLNLTRYKVPNPSAYFLGQKKLGVKIWDIYAHLINATGSHAKFEVGSDGALEAKIEERVVSNKRKVVALFTKVLRFDKEGKATVWLDIPDYQGALKIMALAWNREATGVAEGLMRVKDSISTEYYMPRFLSVGDVAHTRFSIEFDEVAPQGEYEIKVEAEGAVKTKDRAFSFVKKTDKSERFGEEIEIEAYRYGEGNVTIFVFKDGMKLAHKSWQIGIRSKYPQAYVRKLGILQVNSTFEANVVVDHNVWSSIHSPKLTISGKPILPVSSLKEELIEYGGRCAEQTTSRAMPWLFTKGEKRTQAVVKRAIERLLTYQKVEGGFGLWQRSPKNLWVSAYVLDFLTRAKKKGYAVPSKNIESGLNWLENHLDRWSESTYEQEANVYALYVLNRAGRTLMSEMKFYASNKKGYIKSPQAFGQLGAAFAYVGEKKLAHEMFTLAQRALIRDVGYYYYNYGGRLRDQASLIFLMKESGLAIDWENHFVRLSERVKKRRYAFSTQEMSLLLKTAYSVDSGVKQGRLDLKLESGKVIKREKRYETKAKHLRELPKVENQGTHSVWYDLSFKATPVASYYQRYNNNGFTLSKDIYTMQGVDVNISQVRQNQRLVVVLRGKIEVLGIENPLITDWVPAGFELENPTITGIDATKSLEWLETQSQSENRAYRDDRFEAALDRAAMKRDGNFTVAYIVRAVSKGKFTLPPALVEDMYQPQYRGFSTFYTDDLEIRDTEERVRVPKVKRTHQMKAEEEKRTVVLDTKVYQRLFDAPIGELKDYTIVQLMTLRNALFAYKGLDFKKTNPMLHKAFSAFSWYKPESEKSGQIYQSLNAIQKRNVHALLNEEKRRGGGLVLSDFYKVYHAPLKRESLKKYTKKQLRILRNSLLARYGYDYRKRSESLDSIYRHMPWYAPTDVNSSHVLDVQMRAYEKANVLLILEREKEL